MVVTMMSCFQTKKNVDSEPEGQVQENTDLDTKQELMIQENADLSDHLAFKGVSIDGTLNEHVSKQ